MKEKHARERIRELRESKKYTRQVLAEKANISEKFLYEIETGKSGFSAETLSQLSRALAVSCDYIMFGEEKEDQSLENIICTLELLSPRQLDKIQQVLKILCDMCEGK